MNPGRRLYRFVPQVWHTFCSLPAQRGSPKEVMAEHRGLVQFAKDADIINRSADSRAISHKLNPAFDASALEIHAALLNGGTLICIDTQAVWDYALLEQIFVEKKKKKKSDRILDNSYVEKDVVKARQLGGARMINSYGPTENSVVSTMYCIPLDEEAVNGVPIGQSIGDDTGAYVMDPNLRLVPIGVMGELVVTGNGLARGHTDQELNTSRFITVNIGGQPTLAYRTGDLVRYRPSDGQLEFFSRMEHQVKIRGHRMELAEIENCLLMDLSVDAAVTVAQMQGSQNQGLVSFVTVHDTHDLWTKPEQPGIRSRAS
ncbi:nonribosomal peptide synthase, putative [Aspergillus udagawae]|nr:nonribosomal peptide synthase, putative [Aspergillus udagawae]